MSLEQNKNVARRFNEAFNTGNFNLLDDVATADMIQHNPQMPQGRDGVKGFFGMLRAAFSNPQFNTTAIIAEGDMVVSYWTFSGTHTGNMMGIPATGKPVTFTGVEIYRVVDGKAVEHWDVSDQLAFMMQIGVVPMPGQS